MTSEPIPAVGYLRVSTTEQAEGGHGLEIQRDKIIAWAEENNRVIVSWRVDAGKSGSNGIDSRDGLADALADLGSDGDKRADEIVILNLTRLARDLIVQELFLAEVRALGAAIRSCSAEEDRVLQGDDDDDEDGLSRKLIRTMLGAISDYERASVKLRLRRGRRRKMAHNGYGGGVLGWGTLVDHDGYLVPDPACAEAIALITRMRGQGKGYRAIADALNEAGLPGPNGRKPGDVGTFGDTWHATGVRRAWLRLERVVAA